MTKNNKSILTLGEHEWPYHLDPLFFDATSHHFAFKSLHYSLLSLHRKNGPIGMAAESWSVSEDKKTWKFKIRKNLTFANGDAITPDSIRISLTRAFFKIRENNSKHDIINYLEGINQVKSPLSEFPGLRSTNEEVIFTLKIPVKNFLENISFGLFGITHKSQWDSVTGDWIDPRKTIPSGSYSITEWTDSNIKLNIRSENILPHFHRHPYETIVIEKTNGAFSNHDIYEGSEMNIYDKNKYQFEQGGQILISFLKCLSWSSPKSPFYYIDDRLKFREIFYKNFSNTITIEPSFFSHLFGKSDSLSLETKNQSNRNYSWKGAKKINVFFRRRGYFFEEALISSLEKTAHELNLTINFKENALADLAKDLSQGKESYNLDLANINTTLLIENPIDDIKFMYFSQEGIRLPDFKQIAEVELKREAPDFLRIDQALLDHAVVWTYKHHSLGYFYKKHVDLSIVNPNIPPFEFAFIGQR